ncbi:group II truncated hemoglobin [Coralliovum pocilloporae]|uniref:group II truncated hemoglobin n=1 Tax=Coralliovum pocilloporae TaxID=3066369 RepID=UPI0033076E9C
MTATLYSRIGEDRIRALAERFYDIMETRPQARSLLELHFDGHGLAHARIEQFNFLCGFFGGPHYYKEKYGHMNVRLMHKHVDVTKEHAETWLTCMDEAIDDCITDPTLATQMQEAFRRVALSLVNA